MQYTVYAIHTELLGDSSLVTEDDIEKVNTLLAEELQKAGITDCSIIMSDSSGYSSLTHQDELKDVVDTALQRFLDEN